MQPTGAFQGLERLRVDLEQFATVIDARWMLRRKVDHHRVALLVSREGHCLADLLWRWRSGDLAMDPAGVISNHLDLESVATREGLPFVHVPFRADGKTAAFAAIQEQLADWEVDTVVLARFMQIIPPDMCERWSGRMINIHHSFLPAFAGAQPYRQAR